MRQLCTIRCTTTVPSIKRIKMGNEAMRQYSMGISGDALLRRAVTPNAASEMLAHALALPLSDTISFLREMPALDLTLDKEPSVKGQLFEQVDTALHSALHLRDEDALSEVHKTLFALYELHVADEISLSTTNQFDPTLTSVRRKIEDAWLERESHLMPDDFLTLYPSLRQTLKDMCASHRASSHKLFDFLEREASLPQITKFFRSDSALNIRFFDLLLYTMVGSRESVRKELTQNFWDECGHGNPARSHVNLFRRLLDVVGVGQAPDDHVSELGWQGLAGYNLFMLTSLNRKHYYKLLGIMSMTEMLDPSQYEKLARGCRRVGLGHSGELDYYDEHVTIDVVHADGWISNVIAPIVNETPQVASDILLGAALRLTTCAEYYDALHRKLLSV